MKTNKIVLQALLLCNTLLSACSPEAVTEASTEVPKSDVTVPETPGTDEPEVLYERDFTTDIDLKEYQMINADGIDIDTPNYIGNWHQYKRGREIFLSSYIVDKDHEHDHWLITEGFDIRKTRAIVSWSMVADYRDESYEVYISTSPEKDSFTKRIFEGTLPQWTPEMEKNDQGKVEYILEGYEGKTIYLAFRHTASGNNGVMLTLKKLTITSFFYDKENLATDKVWLTYPDFLHPGTNTDTGIIYPPGTKLNVSMEVKNLGKGIRNEDLVLSYKYGDSEVSETVSGIYLPHDETWVYTFKQQLLIPEKPLSDTLLVTATVRLLAEEGQAETNSRSIEITLMKGDPKYRILFEKLSKLNCVPCGEAFYTFDQLAEAYPERIIGITTMSDNGLNPPSTYAKNYHNMITSISNTPGTPAVCYDRTSKANPEFASLKAIMSNGIFTSRMFPPFTIDVTHDFSTDGTIMYIHVAATCLLDQQNTNLNLAAFVLEDNIKEYPNQVGVPNAVHNHIVRDILGESWKNGVADVIPANAKAGETYIHTFEYSVPPKYGKHFTDLTQLYAVGSIIDLTSEKIINSNKSIKSIDKSHK